MLYFISITILLIFFIGVSIRKNRKIKKLKRKLSGLNKTHDIRYLDRNSVARLFISGKGIEVGACDNPVLIDKNHAEVKYVDKYTKQDTLKIFPYLDPNKVVEVDMIDDGENLLGIDNESQDFVITNHMLEHCQNPISSLINFFRVLKKNGILYITIPDKRFNNIDKDRTLTTLAHVIKDYQEGPQASKIEHIKECLIKSDHLLPNSDEYKRRYQDHVNGSPNIHFHAMTQNEILELFIYIRRNFNINFEIELVYFDYFEVLLIIRKQ